MRTGEIKEMWALWDAVAKRPLTEAESARLRELERLYRAMVAQEKKHGK